MVPDEYIEKAKNDLHIAYEHTSHGSQLVTGMNVLRYHSEYGDKYLWTDDGSDGLDFDDDSIGGNDLGADDLVSGVTRWSYQTRTMLDNPTNNHINVVMWSWCNIDYHDCQLYVDNMELLINEYPNVTFVFMTGHSVGDGENMGLKRVYYNNQLIRQHCIDNDRLLFDFADIEAYDPNSNYYWDLNLYDNLDYDSGNWGIQWCNANPGHELQILTSECGYCSHSGAAGEGNTINCVLKGRAVWWMMACIAGWDGQTN